MELSLGVDRLQTADSREEADGAVLTDAQEALLSVCTSPEANQAYVVCRASRLRGPLDVDRLERCMRVLIARHPALRISIHQTDGAPIQRIEPPEQIARAFVLQRGALSEAEADAAALTRHVEATLARPFDLSQAPLFRAGCWQVATDDHVVVLALHHIVGDGMSLGLLHRDIAQLYADDTRVEGLAAPSSAFVDFARWQHSGAAAERFEAARQYWRDVLQDVPTLDLPADFPRPPRVSFRGRTLRQAVDPELAAGVRALAQRLGSTRLRVYLAAFQILLLRLTGAHDVAVGVSASIRHDVDLADVVGYLVNTLAIRLQVGAEGEAPTFAEVLAVTHRRVDEAVEHDVLPFDQVAAAVGQPHDPSRNPICQTALSLEALSDRALHLAGTRASSVELERDFSLFDLSVAVFDDAQGAAAYWHFRTDLFEAATVEQFARSYVQLLRSIVADPGQRIDRLDMLDAQGRDRILGQFNGADLRDPLDVPLREWFGRHAASAPDAVALEQGARTMSYGELDRLSTAWARHLVAAGVRPDAIVAVCMHRSFELVVALWAILKAGGAFLPLDPEYPEARLSMMIEDAEPVVLLTQPSVLEALPSLAPRCPTFALRDAEGPPGECTASLPDAAQCGGGNLAYVIYTSGSTGKPKGVLIERRGLRNMMCFLRETLALDASDRILQSTSVAFDAGIWQYFAALIAGARLVLAEPGEQRDLQRLMHTIVDKQVTVARFVPSMLRALLEEDLRGGAARLRHVVCGGEVLDAPLAKRFHAAFPAVRLSNSYGPSETSIAATWGDLDPQSMGEMRTVSIGRTITNARVYVLDPQGQLQPVGGRGEFTSAAWAWGAVICVARR